jgi:hypothetical protein
LKRLADAGLGWPLPAEITDTVLEAQLFTAVGNVNRTVDGAIPTRWAISLPDSPAVFNRSTSRTWRNAIPFHGKSQRSGR